jgi:anti-sigma factor ChrR (cupin superfamily)
LAGGYAGSRVLLYPGLAEHGTLIADLPVGMRIPEHAHSAPELTFVLDGELMDDAAQRFGPGELLEMHAGSQHAISVIGEHACLAVFRGEPRRV